MQADRHQREASAASVSDNVLTLHDTAAKQDLGGVLGSRAEWVGVAGLYASLMAVSQ